MIFSVSTSTKTLQLRLKDKHLSGYDLQKYTAGFSKCEDVSVGSGTARNSPCRLRPR